MSIPIIDELKPLGNFPAVDASDVQAGNKRLSQVLSETPSTAYVDAVVDNKVDKVEGKGLSTNDYTTAEKNKLSGIEANANNYVHPTTAGSKHIPAGGSAGKILGWAADGTAQWVDDHNTEYSDATTSTHGLMSAADKAKLNGIEAQANKTVISTSVPSTPTDGTVPSMKLVADTYAPNSSLVQGLATKADVSTVTSLTGRVTDVETEQAALDARMDTFTHLSEGSTTGDAELTDIRVKADGTLANSAGTAVRTQITETNDKINGFMKVYPEYKDGYYLSPSGVERSLAMYSITDYIKCDGSSVKAKVFVSADSSAVVFYTESKTVISGYNMGETNGVLADVTIPDGTYYVRFTTKQANKSATDIYVYRPINQLVEQNKELESEINLLRTPLENSLTTGKYVAYQTGAILDLGSLSYIEFNVENVKAITYNHKLSALDSSGLAFYDSDGVYISGVQWAQEDLAITIPANAAICRATVKNTNDVIVSVSAVEINNKLKEIEKHGSIALYNTNPSDIIDGYYVAYSSGGVAPLSTAKYIMLNVSGVRQMIYYNTMTNPDLRGLAFYDISGQFISGVQIGTAKQILNVPTNAALCKATVRSFEDIEYVLDANDLLKTNSDVEKSHITVLTAFDNITCIGDSLTYSQVYTGQSASRQAYVPYPKALGKITGTTTEGVARPGATPLSWWAEFSGSITSKQNQLFIIYLGTNAGLTDTLEEDAPESSEWSEWAETNTGTYAKIVAKAKSVGGKVLLIKCYATSGTGDADLSTTNDVIEQIAERFECSIVGSIKLSDYKFHCYPDRSGVNGVHYNDLGYSAFASTLNDVVGKLDDNNLKYIVPNA